MGGKNKTKRMGENNSVDQVREFAYVKSVLTCREDEWEELILYRSN